MANLKAHEMRDKGKEELVSLLDERKQELSRLRVEKTTGAAASKLAKIRVVRKQIARILTVYNQSQKAELRALYKGKKFAPKDLRQKKTRAMRRALKKSELFVRVPAQPLTDKSGKASQKYVRRQTTRQMKRAANFPLRVYAVKA
mmetsp:Transcript_15508/g.23100  ORF Transcript_15508/g.23100 Transcript_15508/m.23100 type:complete len:145 (+) Transcript_15508:85-519(+)